tara:strand:- start:1078 stop:1656 length:579 start_codon:yes stop_codon:yes gene_type:complete
MRAQGIFFKYFVRILHRVYEKIDQDLRAEYDRSLSFQDGFFDRWERAKRLGFSEGASIYNSAAVFGKVIVGRRTWIGPNALLDGSGGELTIGEFCSISAGVHIYTHDTMSWALTGGKAVARKGNVSIGDHCYIAAQCVISAGVSIGEGAVVAANSFVNKDLVGGFVYAGSPVCQIGKIRIIGEHVSIDYFDK